jgi:tetratricopeptide (TPR) repeat protein
LTSEGNSRQPADNIDNSEEESSGEKTAAEAPLRSPQEETADIDWRKPKITVVRSQRSFTDMPALTKPLAGKTGPRQTVASNEDEEKATFDATPESDANATGEGTEASPADYAKAVSEQDVTVLTGAIQPAARGDTTKVLKGSPVVLPRHAIGADLDLNGPNSGSRERVETRFVFPDPDQPVPPPQAPPQFLNDQGHTRPADASRDRSQFGTGSKHGGAPIALLTNVQRSRAKVSGSFSSLQMLKENLLLVILIPPVILLSATLFINRDTKSDALPNLDLSILTTGQNLDEVNRLINAKNYPAALQLCDSVLQKDTKYAEAYHTRGQIYMAMHRYREAVDDLTTAESFNHRSIDIHIDRAAALFHVQDFDKANKEYDEILSMEPNNAPAHFGKGLTEENLGMTKEAMGDFKKTLELQPDYAAAYEEMGTIHFAKNELKDAYDAYSNAIKIASTVPRFYFNRANTLKQDHQVKRAIADYCKAIQLDSSRPEFFNNRGLLYLENNEPSKAMTDFSSAVDLDPDYTIAKHNLTLAQERVRR